MNYGSICSGIEAASVAWEPLGWNPIFFSEIAPFPSAVLAHRWPNIPNLGDFTTINKDKINGRQIDLLIGGTPCQSFSVQGNQLGLADERGNLSLEYVRLAHRLDARWIVWENVPNALYTNGGRDFAAILSLFSGQDVQPSTRWQTSGIVTPASSRDFGLAWRVLDASQVRVDGFERAIPQGRRRLFVVGYRGDWKRPFSVLHDAPSGAGDAQTVRSPSARRGRRHPVSRRNGVWCFNGGKVNRNEKRRPQNPTRYEQAFTLTACFRHYLLDGRNGSAIARRMTPLEYERCMGFADNHTQIPWNGRTADQCPDGHRYHACGNSMPVNVIRAIGMRINEVEKEAI